jgi:hypothetical protein
MTHSFRESISWIISPFKFWSATIFLHAHLQVVYYKCVKFHKNPISRLGRVVLTRYMDGRTGWFLYTPQTLFAGGINRVLPLPLGNHMAKFGKDPIYRTKVIVRKRSCLSKIIFIVTVTLTFDLMTPK